MNLKVFIKSWIEGGRSYSLNFVVIRWDGFSCAQYFQWKQKRFDLIFPKGKGLPGGWGVGVFVQC